MALGVVHVYFPRYFNWKQDLQSLSLINRQMMQAHTFFLALTVFLVGLLCVTSSTDLVHTKLGKSLCLGLSVFWGIRFVFQHFVYSSDLWKGKRFETIVHVVFSVLWLYLAGVFGMIFFNG